MSSTSTCSFSRNGPALFSTEEVLELMRVEFDRAQRYDHPISCLMIQVDRLEQLHTLHGYESKQEIIMGLVELLKRATRAGDFLGTQIRNRILTIFPHTDQSGARHLADRILEGVRKMIFDGGGHDVRISVSIGLAHNEHQGALCFDTFVRVAGEGLEVAERAGGDRLCESDLYAQHEERRARSREPQAPLIQGLKAETPREAPREQPREQEETSMLGHERRRKDRRDHETRAPVAAPAQTSKSSGTRRPQPPPAAPEAALPAASGPGRARLIQLVESEGSLELAVARMAEDIVNQALSEIEQESERQSSEREDEHSRSIDILERRVTKLSASIGITEKELYRLRELKDVDPGLASIYQSVQGIASGEPHAELKRGLMATIFAANLDLRSAATSPE